MLKPRSLLLVGLATALCALQIGCAVTPEKRAKSAPASLRLDPTQGLMALKITCNRQMTSTFFVKWTTLRVKNIESNATTIVDDRADSSAAHSLFLAPLPAGVYEVEGVGNESSGWLTLTASANAGQALPRFRVESGRLTELGTLAYIRHHFPVNSAWFRWGQQNSRFDREAVLRQLDPSLSSMLSSMPVNTWSEGDRLNALRVVYAASTQLTMRASSPITRTDGTLLLGESFGQISVRSPLGKWTRMQTPTTLPIRALHLARDGSLYAGSDDGTLLIRKANGADWESLPLPVNDASVIHVGDLPDTDQLLVVLQTRDRFIGLTPSATPGSGWKEQFSRPRALSLNPAHDANGTVLESGKRIIVATGSAVSNIELVVLDPGSENWKIANLDENGAPTNWAPIPGGSIWAPIPGGSIGRFRGIPLTGMYFSASQDGGLTWEKRGNLNWTNGSLLFASNRVGYVVRIDSIPLIDAEKFELSLWRTDDSGRTWNKVGPTPALHGRLIHLAGDNQIAYASLNGKFFTSSDGGKTWRLERQLESRWTSPNRVP